MRTSRSVVIGVDSSTQSTKAVAVDAETGELLAVGRAPHTVTGTGGARESDPEEWWTALVTAVRAAVRDAGVPAGSVTGIAVAGQQHGLVTLGADEYGLCARRCSGTTRARRRRPPPSPPVSAARSPGWSAPVRSRSPP